MNKNIGSTDRILRLVAGVILLGAGMSVFSSALMTTLSLVVGLVLIGTALVRFCPMYRLLGISTCPVPKESSGS